MEFDLVGHHLDLKKIWYISNILLITNININNIAATYVT